MKHIYNIIFYSICGFFYETILKLIFSFNYDSGILYGPYTLLYGICIALMFYIFDNTKVSSVIRKNIVFFFMSIIIISLIEWLTGFMLEKLFNLVYWNYSNYPLNVGKYISIPTSIFWSIGIIIIYNYVKPLTDKLYNKINKKIIIAFALIILIDFIVSFIIKLKV